MSKMFNLLWFLIVLITSCYGNADYWSDDEIFKCYRIFYDNNYRLEVLMDTIAEDITYYSHFPSSDTTKVSFFDLIRAVYPLKGPARTLFYRYLPVLWKRLPEYYKDFYGYDLVAFIKEAILGRRPYYNTPSRAEERYAIEQSFEKAVLHLENHEEDLLISEVLKHFDLPFVGWDKVHDYILKSIGAYVKEFDRMDLGKAFISNYLASHFYKGSSPYPFREIRDLITNEDVHAFFSDADNRKQLNDRLAADLWLSDPPTSSSSSSQRGIQGSRSSTNKFTPRIFPSKRRHSESSSSKDASSSKSEAVKPHSKSSTLVDIISSPKQKSKEYSSFLGKSRSSSGSKMSSTDDHESSPYKKNSSSNSPSSSSATKSFHKRFQ